MKINKTIFLSLAIGFLAISAGAEARSHFSFNFGAALFQPRVCMTPCYVERPCYVEEYYYPCERYERVVVESRPCCTREYVYPVYQERVIRHSHPAYPRYR